MNSLPKGFLLGASTAAHQVEGNNVHSDFWAIEQVPGLMFKEPSGDCVDHYHRFREDIDLLADAGLNAYRFSIEWARIEPQQGNYSSEEISHYREVLEYCRQKGVTPVVTMHHFSSPKWLIEQGGWEDERTVEAFAAYCAYVVEQLGGLMEYVCTINEANMGLQIAKIAKSMSKDVQVGLGGDFEKIMKERMGKLSAIFGDIDPRNIQLFLSKRTEEGDIVIMKAHEKARDMMKAICPHLKIGVTLSIYDFQTVSGGEQEMQEELNDEFLHYLPYLEKDDFFGLQNYTRKIFGADGVIPPSDDVELTQMNYEFYPQSIGHVARLVAQHLNVPIIITENGVATSDDQRRIAFIQEAMTSVKECIDDGIPIVGYMHWSLLDNFEWMLGFDITFGLIEVDRNTQKRKPKESLFVLGRQLERE